MGRQSFKEMLQNQAAYGIFVYLAGWPGFMEQLALAGYDFVIIDTEHSSLSYAQVQALAQNARQAGLHPIVRVTDKHYHLVARALDMGVDSLMMPTVETLEQAENLVRWARFPPMGRRGAGSAAIVLAGDQRRYIQETNENGLLVIQIETKTGVENLDQILGVAGIDAILVGPLDLSVSLGFPGEAQHPVVAAAIEQVIARSRRAGKIAGLMCEPEQAAAYARMGAHLLAIGLDLGFLHSAAQQAIRKARQEPGKKDVEP